MTQRPATGVDQIGINMLRIVIGTFFMAVALELIEGFDPATLFMPIMGPTISKAIGSLILLALAIWFMLGAALRLAALSLALFVLASSFTANFIMAPVENLSAFWYDLTLCCSVLLSYLTLDERRLQRASVLSLHARTRKRAAQAHVKQRRMAAETPVTEPKKQSHRPDAKSAVAEEANIFANLRG